MTLSILFWKCFAATKHFQVKWRGFVLMDVRRKFFVKQLWRSASFRLETVSRYKTPPKVSLAGASHVHIQLKCVWIFTLQVFYLNKGRIGLTEILFIWQTFHPLRGLLSKWLVRGRNMWFLSTHMVGPHGLPSRVWLGPRKQSQLTPRYSSLRFPPVFAALSSRGTGMDERICCQIYGHRSCFWGWDHMILRQWNVMFSTFS